MSRRQHRVEELLRREIAQMLLRGELRDPRLQPASAIGITGVEVSADLSVATVYVDVLSPPESVARDREALASVLAALRAAGGLIRRKLSDRVQMRRSPELRFAYDQAIARGARVEAILAELGTQPAVDKGESERSEPACEEEDP
jgi:ribosome-binding factor A